MPIPPEMSLPPMTTPAVPRGVFRAPVAFDGLVVFVATDSRGRLRQRVEVDLTDATPEFEDALMAWLDRVDPPALRLVS